MLERAPLIKLANFLRLKVICPKTLEGSNCKEFTLQATTTMTAIKVPQEMN